MRAYKQLQLIIKSSGWETITSFGLLVFIPLIALAANADILGNKIADIDPWFYFGHLTSLGQYRNVDAFIGNNYYQTRLPYLIPGFVIFSTFKESVAKFVLAYLSYAVSIISIYYIISSNFGMRTARLVTVLFATDIFFVRAFGWNYIDIAVLAYYSIGLAAMTWAAKTNDRFLLKIGVSGFAFVCMLIMHLAAIVLALPAFIYFCYCFWGRRSISRSMIGLVLGGILAQILFGILNMLIWGSRFFFLIEQWQVAKIEMTNNPSWESPYLLLGNGPWLTTSLGVWIGSLIMTIAVVCRQSSLPNRDHYMLIIVIIFFSGLFAFDAAHLTTFTMREGMRMTFFLPVTYACIAIFIKPIQSRFGELLIVALAVLALFFNLHVPLRENLVDGRIVAICISVSLCGALLLSRPAFIVTSLAAMIASRFFVVWPFAQEQSIYQAHSLVKSIVGKDLPRFVFDEGDPLYALIFAPIVSSFTERAWWLRVSSFPQTRINELWTEKRVVVLSSTINAERAEKLLSANVDRIQPIGSLNLGEGQKRFYLSLFLVSNQITSGPVLQNIDPRREINSASLPSQFGGQTIVGKARTTDEQHTGAGYLTFGPYISLAKGKYAVTFNYGPSIGTQKWDLVSTNNSGQQIVFKAGEFLTTAENAQEMTVDLDIANPVSMFEARTYFSGVGALTINSIHIRPYK